MLAEVDDLDNDDNDDDEHDDHDNDDEDNNDDDEAKSGGGREREAKPRMMGGEIGTRAWYYRIRYYRVR